MRMVGRFTLSVLLTACAAEPAVVFGAPSFRYVIEAPSTLEGEQGEKVRFEASARIVTEGLNAGEPGVEAWSMGIEVANCTILEAVVDGTASNPTNDEADFIDVQEVPSGVVLAVVLDTEAANPRTLDPAGSPHEVLRLILEGTVRTGTGCSTALLRFVDSLEGTGRVVKNLVTYQQDSYHPALGRKTVDVCPGVCFRSKPFGLGSTPVTKSITLSPEAPRACFSFKGTAGRPLVVTLTDSNSANANALYFRSGGEPSPIDYDRAADENGQASQRLLIPVLPEGFCFVLVQANGFQGASSDLEITFEPADLRVTHFSPRFGGTRSAIRAAVEGLGFSSETRFALVHSVTGDRIEGTEISVVSSERAEVLFPADASPAGVYGVEAEEGGFKAAILPDAFELLENPLPEVLDVQVIGQARYRLGRLSRMTVRCRNKGQVDIPAPLLKLIGPPKTRMRLGSEPDYHAPGVPLLAFAGNLDGNAGRLSPGSVAEIPVVFESTDCSPDDADGSCPVEFIVHFLTPNRTDLVGWTSLPAPVGMTQAAWNAVKDDLEASLKNTWRECAEGFAGIASRIARKGLDGRSAIEVLRHAVRELSGRPTGAITGTLFESSSSVALAGAKVAALQGGAIRACGATDAQGGFSLRCLEPGAYELKVEGRSPKAGKGVEVVLPADDLLAYRLEISGDSGDFEIDGTCASCDAAGLPSEFLAVPDLLFTRFGALETAIVFPIDPNVKDSDEEADEEAKNKKQVGINKEILFTIYFENKSGATVPAQIVTITDELDENLDLRTVRFVDMRWSRFIIPFRTDYTGSTLLRRLSVQQDWSGRSWDLEVVTTASILPGTRTLQWTFETVDPRTRETPEDADAGFLLPNDKETDVPRTYRGEGYVSFLVKPDAAKLDPSIVVKIKNKATIAFDRARSETTPEIEREVIFSPDPPLNSVPADRRDHRVELDSPLCWSSSTRADVFDIYLWKEGETEPAESTALGISGPCFHPPGGLEPDTDYNWRVVSRSTRVSGSAVSGVEPWRFTTKEVGLPTERPFRRGDVDANGRLEVTDAIQLLEYLFLGGAKPECLDAADTDDSGIADISDAISNLGYQFLGGVAPAPPGPASCGLDFSLETPDLGCSASCQ